MSPRFCEHLEEYGSLYIRTEASYYQCNDLVARIIAEGPEPGLVDLLTTTLDEWLSEGRELRDALVELVAEGRVRVPGKNLQCLNDNGLIRCSECRFEIPKLRFPEWEFSGNGKVFFQGEELSVAQSMESG